MSRQRKQSAFRTPHSVLALWLRWVAALTLAGTLAGSVIYLTVGAAGGTFFLPGILMGVCLLAACETWVLARYLRRHRWVFFAATALGAGWGTLVVILLGVASVTGLGGPLGSLTVEYALPLGGAVLGVLTGAAQWLVLRRHPGRTDLWVASHAVAGLAATTLLFLISGWLGGEANLLNTLVAAVPASAIAGAISGLGVVRLASR